MQYAMLSMTATATPARCVRPHSRQASAALSGVGATSAGQFRSAVLRTSSSSRASTRTGAVAMAAAGAGSVRFDVQGKEVTRPAHWSHAVTFIAFPLKALIPDVLTDLALQLVRRHLSSRPHSASTPRRRLGTRWSSSPAQTVFARCVYVGKNDNDGPVVDVPLKSALELSKLLPVHALNRNH